MSLAASDPTSSVIDAPRRPARRWPLVLAGLGTVSAVFAALVIFSSTTATAPRRVPVAQVGVSSEVLTVGSSRAPTKVVVYEDFGSPESRTFEISSRDFLRGEAAEGRVVMEYHPVTLVDSEYSDGAVVAWGVVADRGTPGQALALHDLIFDQQPTPGGPQPRDFIALAKQAGVKDGAVLDAIGAAEQAPAAGRAAGAKARPAGVSRTPSVLVDGTPLTATSPVALADRLQRLILHKVGAP